MGNLHVQTLTSNHQSTKTILPFLGTVDWKCIGFQIRQSSSFVIKIVEATSFAELPRDLALNEVSLL